MAKIPKAAPNLSFADFRAQLAQAAEGSDEAAGLTESYIAAHIGNFPVVEGDTAHFLTPEQPGHIVGVSGEWNAFDARRSLMEPIGGGLLHYERHFEPDARLDYLFTAIPERLRHHLESSKSMSRLKLLRERDTFNTRTSGSGFGDRSELAMPEYKRSAETLPQPGVSKGEVHEHYLSSRILGHGRVYSVYLPAGYDEATAYPSIYFHDGIDYLNMGEATTIIDNLIGFGALPPLVAIFAAPQNRSLEYDCNEPYATYFADELVPRVHSQYNLINDPTRRAVIGPSLAGLVSLYMTYMRPDTFLLAAAQSTVVHGVTRRSARFDARKLFLAPADGARIYLAIGTYEECFSIDREGNCRDLLTPAREFRDLLQERGYSVRYTEKHQSHSWGLWRDTLADALTFLFV